MSLLDEYMTPCVMLDCTQQPDGEGGFTDAWVDGTQFSAAIVENRTDNTRIAEKERETSLFTVTTPIDTSLSFHDVFKRTSDNKIFRVTSDNSENKTPQRASFQIAQCTAEEWRLT